MERRAVVERKTKETQIKLELFIDGKGESSVDTGIGFFDHMLTGFAKHGLFDLTVKVTGDLFVDGHHTVEDVGIVLGQAIKEACQEKTGIRRYGHAILPMDDALILCAIDFCGRPYFSYDLAMKAEQVGYFDTELCREFFYSVSYSAGMNLHIKQFSGENSHHILEAAFKAFAKALDTATQKDERIEGVMSTKGTIEA